MKLSVAEMMESLDGKLHVNGANMVGSKPSKRREVQGSLTFQLMMQSRNQLQGPLVDDADPFLVASKSDRLSGLEQQPGSFPVQGSADWVRQDSESEAKQQKGKGERLINGLVMLNKSQRYKSATGSVRCAERVCSLSGGAVSGRCGLPI